MAETVAGRLVLEDRVVAGRLIVEGGRIAALEPDADVTGPYVAPGFVDLHLHGWGGHDATGDAGALAGMARALLRRGVTSFLPTAPALRLEEAARFVERVRSAASLAPADGAEPLGSNLEGPCLAVARKGAHDPARLRAPDELTDGWLEPAVAGPAGLRVMTVAPELPGAMGLIARLVAHGVVVSLGHSDAGLAAARAGYGAGARSTTHLFNAMSGVDHRAPGLAAAALAEDDVFVELIADGQHVQPSLWRTVARAKPSDRLVLVSDALPLAGCGDGATRIGSLEVTVRSGRATVAGTETLAGSVIALDDAVRNLVREGIALPSAVAAASANPAALLGLTDRGRLEVGRLAHLVLLDDDLRVLRARRGDGWVQPA